jgi:hypothetical protein
MTLTNSLQDALDQECRAEKPLTIEPGTRSRTIKPSKKDFKQLDTLIGGQFQRIENHPEGVIF